MNIDSIKMGWWIGALVSLCQCTGLTLPGTDFRELDGQPYHSDQPPHGSPSDKKDRDDSLFHAQGAAVIGRTLTLQTTTWLSWSGTSLLVAFQGSGIQLKLGSPVANQDERATYDVYLDGQQAKRITGTLEDEPIPLAENLGSGTHQLRIVRRVEPQFGTDRFEGFVLPADGQLLPPPPLPSRRMLFLGDSTMAGWGVDVKAQGDGNHCFNNASNQNVQQSYVWLVGQALGAQSQVLAISGKGLLRNRSPSFDQNMTMAWHYDYTLANVQGTTVPWDPQHYPLDMMLVNLGGNDFATSDGHPPLDVGAWQMAHAKLIGQVRKDFPQALIVVAMGPTLHGNDIPMARQALQQLVQQLADPDVLMIEFPEDNGSLLYGCNFHASQERHQMMAKMLLAMIATRRPSWTQP